MKATWSPKSVRFSHGLETFALRRGVKPLTAKHFMSAITADIRRDVEANAVTSILVTTKSGVSKTLEAKEFDTTQRVTGTGQKQKLTVGEKSQYLTGNCALWVQSLIDLDECLAALEKRGHGVDWTPPVGSLEERQLLATFYKVRQQHEPPIEQDASPAPSPLPSVATLG